MRYHQPTELSDALDFLDEVSPTVLAGGTDLFPATEMPRLAGDILDLTAIESLQGVSETDADYRIGAASKWSEIIAADLPPAFEALKLSANEVGSLQIQNMGTIGGNICNASPAADGVPPLLILDAKVELVSNLGSRCLPLTDFVHGNRKTVLRPNELLAAVLVPKGSTRGASHFLKLGARKYLVISIAMVSVRLCTVDSKISEIAISVGSCSEVATRLPRLENALTGQDVSGLEISLSQIAEDLSPIDDVRADGAYRAYAASKLIERSILACHHGA